MFSWAEMWLIFEVKIESELRWSFIFMAFAKQWVHFLFFLFYLFVLKCRASLHWGHLWSGNWAGDHSAVASKSLAAPGTCLGSQECYWDVSVWEPRAVFIFLWEIHSHPQCRQRQPFCLPTFIWSPYSEGCGLLGDPAVPSNQHRSYVCAQACFLLQWVLYVAVGRAHVSFHHHWPAQSANTAVFEKEPAPPTAAPCEHPGKGLEKSISCWPWIEQKAFPIKYGLCVDTASLPCDPGLRVYIKSAWPNLTHAELSLCKPTHRSG